MTNIMQGFPVAPGQRVPHADWDRAPWNRWTYQNVRQLVPTTEVWRGNGSVWVLPRHDLDLHAVPFFDADARRSFIAPSNFRESSLSYGRFAVLMSQRT